MDKALTANAATIDHLHDAIERLNATIRQLQAEVAVKDSALDDMAVVLVEQNTTIERLRYWDAYDAVMAKAQERRRQEKGTAP